MFGAIKNLNHKKHLKTSTSIDVRKAFQTALIVAGLLYTIWPDGRGFTHGRFDEVRNSCTFEKIVLVRPSSKDKTRYKTRFACDDYNSEWNPVKDKNLKRHNVIMQYDGKEDRLIFGNVPQ